jgi:hypothetical protein
MPGSTILKINIGRWASILGLIFAVFGVDANAAQRWSTKICGADQSQPAGRIFAEPDRKHNWREYRGVKEIPELENDFGEFAQLWTSRDGNVLISVQAPGEDFASYMDYCFDSRGQLIELRFQLRTAWGWGYRVEGSILNGKLAPKKSEFFNTKTEMPITKPEQADDIPDALKPIVYLREAQLPFFRLLPKT